MRTIITLLVIFFFGLLMQSCSWFHSFQIKNSTNSNWVVAYELKDERGLFQSRVSIQNNKSKVETIDFKSSIISFELKPNETATIGWGRNTHYDAYKDFSFDGDKTAINTFINIDNIKLSSEKGAYELDPTKLDGLLSKKSKQYARVEIAKVVKKKEPITPDIEKRSKSL